MNIFSFVLQQDTDRIRECGLKTSEYGECRLTVNNGEKDCIIAYLTPNDSPKMNDGAYAPVKIDLNPEIVIVAEGVYRSCNDRKQYEESFVKLSEYSLGKYRKPECIIYETVLPGTIEKYDRRMDEPLFYSSSEELYIDSLFSKAADEIPEFKEIAMKAYFMSKKATGKDAGAYEVFGTSAGEKFICKKDLN